MASGSLGQGLAAAAGMAWARKLDGSAARVYALLGDGEAAEGAVYEAAQYASFNKLDNLCAIVDVNRLGQSGPTMYQHDVGVYADRFEAFGWQVAVVDGHEVAELRDAFARARASSGKPAGPGGPHPQGQGGLVPGGQGRLARQAREEGRGAAEGGGRAGRHQ